MNVLRTSPRDEKPNWVELMFEVGPHIEPGGPTYPLDFPLPFKLSQDVSGGFLYVVYRSKIIGYAKIHHVEPHNGHHVGSDDRPVKPGDNIFVDGPLVRMPLAVRYQGFRGIHYRDINLRGVA